MRVLKAIEDIVAGYMNYLDANLRSGIPEINIDIHETVYAENYAAANAAIIYAFAIQIGGGILETI